MINLSKSELIERYERLNRRFNRVIKLGDRQQRQFIELNEKLNRYIDIVDKNVIISTTDIEGNITYVSEAFCEITGYNKKELIGKKHNILKADNFDREIFNRLWETISNGEIFKGELKNIKKDGEPFWVSIVITPNFEDDKIIGYTAIRNDITDKKLIEEISITDSLTHLYNRRYFNKVFEKEIEIAKENQNSIAFLIMDIDHFKQYNDTYGHQAGDDTLFRVANSISESLSKYTKFIFRLGGEEFGAIFSNLGKDESFNLADRVRLEIENLKIEHRESSASQFVTLSLGLIHMKNSTLTEKEVYKFADDALYRAKNSGRNRVLLSKLS